MRARRSQTCTLSAAAREHLPVHQRVERIGRGEDRAAEGGAVEVAGPQAAGDAYAAAPVARPYLDDADPVEQQRRKEVDQPPALPLGEYARAASLHGYSGVFFSTV